MLGCPACFILFLLCQLSGPAACGTLKKLVGAVGGSVTFPQNLSVHPIDSIIWVFNTTTLVTIQPKTVDKKAVIIVTQQRNKERVDFPNESYSLKLSKLKKNDSGAYRMEMHSSTLQDPLIQEYELRVYASIEEKRGVDTHPEVLSYRPPSGETPEYDTIPHLNNTIPDENSINTLYSTVQIPPKVEKPHPLPTLPDTPKLFTYENII
uniref:Immunoglobulin V-set domain-containing protein n=1 Tax=Catagonus wagneri TaxID=51154 RepID=A0A8C3WGH8_9CETA